MENEIRIYDDPNEDLDDNLLPEYHFDYSKAKLNPYAARALRRKAIILETDIAEIFTTSEQVNKALRALIEAVPIRTHRDKTA
ncbi:MAG: hypothetical protein ACRYFS_06565 [Janthinobacterium lividum]